MYTRPSPASIPLPISNPLSPVIPNAKPPTLIDLLPADARELQNLRGVDFELLRRAMDDGTSSVADSDVPDEGVGTADKMEDEMAMQGSETDQYEEQDEQEPPELAHASSSVPTGDSLFHALRSPSPPAMPVASSSTQHVAAQDPTALPDPITESSGELTRLMARYPLILAGPGASASAPMTQKPVRTMSHESFITNLQAASAGASGMAQRGSGSPKDGRRKAKGKEAKRDGAEPQGLPSSGSHYSEEDADADDLAEYGPNERSIYPPADFTSPRPDTASPPDDQRSPSAAASPRRRWSPSSRSIRSNGSGQHPREPDSSGGSTISAGQNEKLSASLAPVPSSSLSSSPLHAELEAAEARNQRERAALEEDVAQARKEADELERQCEELSQLLISLGFPPPDRPQGPDEEFPRREEVDASEHTQSPPTPRRRSVSPGPTDRAPQTRTVSYHKMNGVDGRRAAAREPAQPDLEAQGALNRISQRLSLPLPALTGTSTGQTAQPSANPYAPRSLDDVVRAMEFLRSVDGLVWKGRREAGRVAGRAGDSIFAEENVQALGDRIGMWERVVRSKR